MKQKDIVYLVVAVVILLAAGYIGYTQLMPKKATAAKGIEVEKVGTIPQDFDSGILQTLSDQTKVRDFSTPIDTTGLGNKALFGS